MDLLKTIENSLGTAGLDSGSALVRGVTQTIERALSSAGLRKEATTPGRARPTASPAPAPSAPGRFLERNYSDAEGSRAYKLYVPTGYHGEPMPLIVMLHGCKQDPDDFAAGTQMNAIAEREGFLVAYPAQSRNENGSNCWNWFRAQDQGRRGGEPALIAGIAREVAIGYAVDPGRVFVAGLSAGAAMAVILGETHPELFAAVGAHSGLPYRAAHDVPSAFSAMAGGSGGAGMQAHAQAAGPSGASRPVPTIVFHGDRDTTVTAANGELIARQAARAFEGAAEPLRSSVQQGRAADGSSFTATVYRAAEGPSRVEHWVLHGAAHAWSGGNSSGSFASESGPSASEEMVRFFKAQKARKAR